MEITLQMIRYFVSVAKNSSYSKAAEECFVSQPALSKSIARMEEELNTDLFERNTRSVKLTEDGEKLFDISMRLLQNYNELIKYVEEKKIESYKLKVGSLTSSYYYIFNRLIEDTDVPIDVDARVESIANLSIMLKNNDIDLAIVPLYTVNQKKYDYIILSKGPLFVIMHKNHPLAEKQEVTLDDIKNENFIGWNEKELPGVTLEHVSILNFRPNFVDNGTRLIDILIKMKKYNAIALSNEGIREVIPAEYRFIPIKGVEERSGIVMVWNKNNKSKSVDYVKSWISSKKQESTI